MILDQLTQKFITQPANLQMGAGKLAIRWKCSKDDIYKAKEKARESLHAAETATLNNAIAQQGKVVEELLAVYTGSEQSADLLTKRFESKQPLSPDSIKELVQVDGVGSYVNRVVDRMLPNGSWTYSVEIKYRNRDFYNKNELKARLREIFPDIKPMSLPIVKKFDEKALMILISDDHAGALNENSIYGNEWNGAMYTKRLLKIANEAKALGVAFEEVHIISLGDQMNGWNAQTTRGGHEVKSLSNKDQFDIYTAGRVAFYNDLFSSGLGKSYQVHDVENSNHTGDDFSYMANKFLEMYLENKFPQVKRKSYFLPVEYFNYGIHTIGLTHGKDEKLMTRPMPLKLDPKTDLFLFQYFDNKGLSPKQRKITMYKGDLHSYAMDKGKFGRYINVPSIMGCTDWTELNFGNSDAGAMMEIFSKDSNVIQHIPLWF